MDLVGQGQPRGCFRFASSKFQEPGPKLLQPDPATGRTMGPMHHPPADFEDFLEQAVVGYILEITPGALQSTTEDVVERLNNSCSNTLEHGCPNPVRDRVPWDG